MDKSLSDNIYTWSREEIEESILNNSLSETQIIQARELLVRFPRLPRKYILELEEKFEALKENEPSKKLKLIAQAHIGIEKETKKEFKKTLNTIEHQLISLNLTLPKDWKEVFLEWYLRKQDLKEYLKSIYDLPISDRKIIFDWAKEYTRNLFSNTANKKNFKTSYKWLNDPKKELPQLYSLIKDKFQLIAKETTNEQFEAIFTEQPIEKIKPLKWHEDNATELLYFITRLEQTNNISHNPKRADYKTLQNCFVKPDGSDFKASWKTLKQNIDISLSEKKKKAIEELISNFL